MPAKSLDLIWKRLSELRITIEGEMQEGKGIRESQRPCEDTTLELEIIYLTFVARRFPFLLFLLEATPLTLVAIL